MQGGTFSYASDTYSVGLLLMQLLLATDSVWDLRQGPSPPPSPPAPAPAPPAPAPKPKPRSPSPAPGGRGAKPKPRTPSPGARRAPRASSKPTTPRTASPAPKPRATSSPGLKRAPSPTPPRAAPPPAPEPSRERRSIVALGPEAMRVPLGFPEAVVEGLHRLAQGCAHPDPQERGKLVPVEHGLKQLLEDCGSAPQECVVCMEATREVRLPCKHKVLCTRCARLLPDCPLCRQPYQEFVVDESSVTFV